MTLYTKYWPLALLPIVVLACGGSTPGLPTGTTDGLLPDSVAQPRPVAVLKTLFSPTINASFSIPYPAQARPIITNNTATNQTIVSTSYTFARPQVATSPVTGVTRQTGTDSSGRFCIIRCTMLENAKVFNLDFYLGGFDTLYVNTNDTLRAGIQLGKTGATNKKPFIVQIKNTGSTKFPVFKTYKGVNDFIDAHKKMLVPANEKHLVVAIKKEYKLYYYQSGKLIETLEMALGQDPIGHKQQTGDNRTPEGEYRISQKAKGPFYSPTGPYLGNSWLELSYPNRYDAYEGFQSSLITQAQAALIVQQDLQKKRTAHNTRLGGLVGLHGWDGEWHPDYREITWGCISLQNVDIDRLYPSLPLNMYILVLP